MEHWYIEDHQIADRYLSGKLPIEERMRFEEHFVDCASCLVHLRTVDDFRAGLRTVATEEAMRLRESPGDGRAGALARIASPFRRRQAPLLAVVILLIALLASLLFLEWKAQ